MIQLVFFLFLVQFPDGCPCFQVPAGPDGDLFAAAEKVLLVLDDDRAERDNTGTYDVLWVGTWPSGIVVVVVDPPPTDPGLVFNFYQIVFDPHGLFYDGFESGGTGRWSATIGGLL